MRYIIAVLVISRVQKFTDGSVNYCGARMCAHTNAHTFCRYPIGASPSCTGYVNAELLAEEKARILARLNRRRSDVARGIRGWPTAGDMMKLRWVEELAHEAQRWADQCAPPSSPEEYDSCRDLYSISVGQCVASVVGEAPGLRPESMVDVWYMQSLHYKSNISTYIPPENYHKNYEDFAQMVWSRSYMVGCGRSRFMSQVRGRFRSVERLVCNFAPRGPVPLRPLWSPALPASVCPPRSRPDEDLPALCDFQHDMDESYDEDNTMSLQEHLLLNTIMELERNVSMDRVGIMDEIYLTKVAVATIETNILTTYNSVQKRDILEIYDTNGILKLNKSQEISTESIIKFKLPTRRYYNIIGRPKAYKVEDLNDPVTKITINEMTEEPSNAEIYNYEDYASAQIKDETSSLITTLMTSSIIPYEIETIQKEVNLTNTIKAIDLPMSDVMMNDMLLSTTTETLDKELLNEMISKLNISNRGNQTDQDILADPDTVRQLEEALDRMEHKLASMEPLHSGKVRRELRNHGNDQKVDSSKLESGKNKSLDRGPMINMVMKYLPYLKPYEKSILGDNYVSNASKICHFRHFSAYFVLLIFCLFECLVIHIGF